jgi:NADPH:quinone reductase-like Zn-dependent oxidoreductase
MTTFRDDRPDGVSPIRAVIHTRYGTPDVLELTDVAKPVPANDEVLVKVHATTVNRTDCGFRAGKPYVVRAFGGLRRPRQPILGTELAGESRRSDRR